MTKKYVVVDTISQYRLRYVISLDELQKFNPDHPVEPEWALDSVTCEELEEFSQRWLGETIVDHRVVSEDTVVELVNTDLPESSHLSIQEKIDLINNLGKRNK